MPSHITRTIAETPLFEELPPERIPQVAAIFSLRTYEPGEQIIGPHERGDRTYVVATGAARISRVEADGRCIAVGLLDSGEVFGRVMFSEPAPGERVEALERPQVLRASAGDFERLLGQEPKVAALVVSGLARRLRACETRLEALAFHQVPARLAQSLVDLAERYGKVTTGGVRIDVRITHGQLAELVATTRETLTKVAGWLRAEGIATLERRQIWVHDYARLEDVAMGLVVMPGRTNRTGEGGVVTPAWGGGRRAAHGEPDMAELARRRLIESAAAALAPAVG